MSAAEPVGTGPRTVRGNLDDLDLSLLEADCFARLIDQDEYRLDEDQQAFCVKALLAAVDDAKAIVKETFDLHMAEKKAAVAPKPKRVRK